MDYVINIIVNFLFYISIPIAIRYLILRKPIKSKWIAIGILVPIFIGCSILINLQRDEAQKKIYKELNMRYKPRPHMIGSPILYLALAFSYSILRRGYKNSTAMKSEPLQQVVGTRNVSSDCPNCKADISTDSVYCHKCGNMLTETDKADDIILLLDEDIEEVFNGDINYLLDEDIEEVFNTRESLTDPKASYLYIEQVFEESKKCWESIRSFLQNHKQIGPELMNKFIYPSETISLAIIGQNMSALVAYSPLFHSNREQAARLEDWTLFNLLSEFSEKLPWTPEETLAKVRHWEQIDYQLVKRLKDIGRNPFGDLTGHLLREFLGDDILKLCQSGTTHLDHFIHTILADMFTIACTTSFSFWKNIIENYQIIQEKPLWDV